MDLAPKEQAFPPMGFLDLQLHLVEIVVWLLGSVLTQPTEKLAIRKENVPAPGKESIAYVLAMVWLCLPSILR